MSDRQQFNDNALLLSPTELFFPYRIIIMKFIYKEKEVSFSNLKNRISITSGNLVSHLRMLEKSNLITFKKEFKNNKPHTTYRLTEKGIDEFIKLKKRLIEFLI